MKQASAFSVCHYKRHSLSLFFLGFAGIDEISVDAYKGVEHSDSEDSDKSDSSDSEYGSDAEQKTKNNQDAAPASETQEETTKKEQTSPNQDKDSKTEKVEPVGDSSVSLDALNKEKPSKDSEKENSEKVPVPPLSPGPREKSQGKDETSQPVPVEDSDSERELVIDLGDDQEGKDKKRNRKDNTAVKDSSAGKSEGMVLFSPFDPKKMVKSDFMLLDILGIITCFCIISGNYL